jgi:hypothetical protein
MAQDAFGNYICDISPVIVSPLPSSMFSGNSGVGPPNNADGNNGDTYVDLQTGTFYTKSGDVWAVVTGAPGPAGASGLTGIVDPNLGGGVVAVVGTSYVNTANYSLWYKTGAGNTQWTAFVL